MNDYEQQLHRTWVQMLAEQGHREAAAVAIDSEVEIVHSGFDPHSLAINVAPSGYGIVQADNHLRSVLELNLLDLAYGRIEDQNGNQVDVPVVFRVKLLEVEDDWQNVVRSMIANASDPNQAVVTEKVGMRDGRQPLLYNEMKFGSKSEIRIAQELEARKVLFFPLPFAVRAETGVFYKDHREPDFLVCHDGTWGVLEVAYHPNRYEKDKEKDAWFKASGILCVEHFPAERCYNSPSEVVDEFMGTLAKHKR
jgi:hypothetical protein